MKTTTCYQHLLIIFSIIVIVSCVCAVKQASAQAEPAATAIGEIKPLKIGDKVPDELWDQNFPVVSTANDQTQMLSFGDYKDKLIILDFWATWCAPCISSLGKLDTLQKEFADDLVIIPTSYEPEEKVRKFFKEKGLQLPTAFEETLLKKYFPYRSIPHQVWIKDGKVLAIPETAYTNRVNIQKAIKDIPVMLSEKKQVDFDSSKPLLIDGNGGGEDRLLFQSVITKRINTNTAGVVPVNEKGVLFYNGSVFDLFGEAYSDITGYSRKKIINELPDSLTQLLDYGDRKLIGDYELDQEYLKWLDEHTFCYNLYSRINLGKGTIYRVMKNDLNDYFSAAFGIQAIVEERTMECLVLEKIGSTDRLLSKGAKSRYKYEKDHTHLVNKNMGMLTGVLNTIDPNRILLNHTNIDKNIDMDFPHALVNNLEKSNEFLKGYGLRITEKKLPIEMVVIKEINK